MEFYVYRYSAADLSEKIEGSTGLAPLLTSALQVSETSFLFPGALTADEKAALDQFMTDNGYAFYRQVPQLAAFRASTKILDGPFAVPASPDWITLGGVVTEPKFFANDLAKIVGQVMGGYRATGVDAAVRLVETETATGLDTVLGLVALPDTGGAWAVLDSLSTTPPAPGKNTYRVEARAGVVADLTFRFMSLVLLETP